MKVRDLSHTFNIEDRVFPGTGKMSFDRTHTIQKDGYNLTAITVNSHAGTHTDAPLHFVDNGKSLSEVDINRYVGNCFVVDLMDKKMNGIITVEDVKPYEQEIKKSGRVILATGWDKNFNTEEFYTIYPSIHVECAKWLVSLGIKMVGVEPPSLSTIAGTEVHDIFLKNDVAVVEGLTNLGDLTGKEIIFCGAPLAFEGMDGFPIRAYAIEL